MRQFTRGLAEVGAEVLGVGDGSPDPELRRYLSDYLEVPSITDEDDVIARVHGWLRGRSVDRVLANWEPLVILAARLRERFGLPGMSVDTVRGFRDKQLMKDRVAAAGLRVPRAQRVRSVKEVWAAVERIGFPAIIKPISGAGSADTYKVESVADLERVLPHLRHVAEASCEEFIDGEEYTYDTASIDGQPAYESVTRYFPNALEMRTNEWISPIMLSVRDLGQPHVRGGIELGRDVLRALGMGDGMTHMEWFLKRNGEVVFGEVACRPGGACVVDQMNYTSDIDLFREWARVVTVGRFEASTERAYNVGIIFKRAQGQGRISGIVGLREYYERYRAHIVLDTLLRPGATRRDWKATLLSDGYLVVRHPDWDQARQMAFAAATDIQLYAS
ncbi:MAG: Carbamoylphosphate synthase large subunit protein [Deltaproteobacteria bacterium]|nr:Carbamoylphosphate synthase large subunit protein [Deltaproteobacteria bacterium]